MESMNDYIRNQIRASIKTKEDLLMDLDLTEHIGQVSQMCIDAYRRGNKVIFAGNGGSAADAQHLAAEFVSRFEYDRPGLPSLSLSTDTSMITAIGNDYGYENLFKRQLEAQSRPGDIFIGITTSGNSKNVLRAFEVCQSLGITSVALCGQGGSAKNMVDVALAVPSTHTARIQECHILIGHIVCGLVEQAMFPK